MASSFPYMALAKRFGYNYREVLQIAELMLRNEPLTSDLATKWDDRVIALRGIYFLVQETKRNRSHG